MAVGPDVGDHGLLGDHAPQREVGGNGDGQDRGGLVRVVAREDERPLPRVQREHDAGRVENIVPAAARGARARSRSHGGAPGSARATTSAVTARRSPTCGSGGAGGGVAMGGRGTTTGGSVIGGTGPTVGMRGRQDAHDAGLRARRRSRRAMRTRFSTPLRARGLADVADFCLGAAGIGGRPRARRRPMPRGMPGAPATGTSSRTPSRSWRHG